MPHNDAARGTHREESMSIKLLLALSCSVSALFCGLSAPAIAQSAPARDFFAGKTIDFIVGTDVGGGLDTYARVIGRHLSGFLPGSPAVVVRNMPGAGSARAAAHLYNVAPKDGTTIAALFPGLIVDPLLQQRTAGQFDPAKFTYLGSADSDARVCMTGPSSRIRTFNQAITEKMAIGATQPGASTSDYAFLHRNATNAKFEIVSGYKGTADVLLAIERGEVEGVCGMDWASLKTQRPDWVRNRTANILVQNAPLPNAELTKLGVPSLDAFVKDEKDRQAVDLVIAQQIFARPYLAPPGLPEQTAKLLRAAFDRVLRDEKFLEDAKNTRLSVHPSSAETVQEAVTKMYRAPDDVVQRARRLMQQSAGK
jgi:tripartite-type tricarboxylate transporter receptor subunit TctC